MKNKPRRDKIPRPEKPPIAPLRHDQTITGEISHEQETLIGRVVVEWSRLEHALNDLLWQMLGLDVDDGRLLTARTDAQRLVAILQTIAHKQLSGNVLNSLLDALDVIDIHRDDRNFIVHGVWGTIKPDHVAAALSMRASAEPGTFTTESFSSERMNTIIHNTSKAREAVVAAINALSP